MAKNFKGKAQRPPLSVVDKVIYSAAIVVGLLSSLTLILWEHFLYQRAYRDPSIVFCNLYDCHLYVVPLCLFCTLVPLFLSTLGVSSRQPLLKSKPLPSPAFTHTIKVDPLFSQAFWKNLSSQRKKVLQKRCVAAGIAFTACLSLALLSFYPRHLLTQSYDFITYNSFDKPIHTGKLESVESLTIRIAPRKGGYTLCFDFAFDDAFYTFAPEHSANVSREESLQYLLFLKSALPKECIRFSGINLVENFANRYRYTDAEAKLLYQLFDATP